MKSFERTSLTENESEAIESAVRVLKNEFYVVAEISNRLPIERKSNDEHLESLQVGIRKFRELAEL